MNVKILLSFAIIYFVWGSTFTAIRIGLDSFPPFILAGLRFMLGGLIFLALSKFSDFKKMNKNDFKENFLIGVLLNFGNAGVCWAQMYIASGVAALIVGSIPILFIIFNWIGFERRIPHISVFIAVALGVTGISLIASDGGANSDWRAVLVLLLANCSWVIGSLKLKMSQSSLSYNSRASVQLIFGSLTLFFYSWVTGDDFSFHQVDLNGVYSVLYLSVVGTAIAYTAYNFLLKNVRTEVTSTYALVNPLFALLLGMIYLKEPFTLKIAMASVFILSSVFLTLYGRIFFKSKRVSPLTEPIQALTE